MTMLYLARIHSLRTPTTELSMLIDCHLHTKRYSRCSRLDPDDMAGLALSRSMDVVVITEHHQLWPAADLAELNERHPDLALFTGQELTLEEGLDLVVIPSDPGFALPPFPAYEAIQPLLEKFKDELFVFVAHPYRWMDMATREQDSIIAACDGMEMNSVNILKGGWKKESGKYAARNAELYDAALAKHGLIPIFNTDAHLDLAVGALVSEVDCDEIPQDQAELVQILKTSRPKERQREQLLTRCLAELRGES